MVSLAAIADAAFLRNSKDNTPKRPSPQVTVATGCARLSAAVPAAPQQSLFDMQ